VIDDFQKLTQKDLPGINSGLKKKKMEAISVLAEADWQKEEGREFASRRRGHARGGGADAGDGLGSDQATLDRH